MKWFVLVIFTIMVGGTLIIDRTVDSDIVAAQTPQVQGASTVESIDPLLKPINAYRESNGVAPLKFSPELKNLTAYRTADMVSRQYYSHISPQSTTYADLIDKYISNSYESCENLNLQQSETIDGAVLNWSESPTHNNCLLNPVLTRGAISIVYYDDVSYSSTQSASNFIVTFVGSN